jgi:HPt (histidine-containing phosphotransfer) domain-containing protein
MDFKALAGNLGLEEEEYMELIELFVERSMSDLNKLEAAIKSGNADEAADAAHSMKGAAGNLGIMDFYESAAKIEMATREGNLEGFSVAIQSLRENLKDIDGLAANKELSPS